MPMEMLNNPVLADEQPPATSKMDSIFIKENQMKNIKSMNIDEKSIMESINGPNKETLEDNNDEEFLDLQFEENGENFAINVKKLADEKFLNQGFNYVPQENFYDYQIFNGRLKTRQLVQQVLDCSQF